MKRRKTLRFKRILPRTVVSQGAPAASGGRCRADVELTSTYNEVLGLYNVRPEFRRQSFVPARDPPPAPWLIIRGAVAPV